MSVKILTFNRVVMFKVQLKHTSVHGNRERSVALMKTIKFNILDRNCVRVDEEMKREQMRSGNSWLLKLRALNNIAILSQKRQEQLIFFNVSLARRTRKNFLRKLKLQAFR